MTTLLAATLPMALLSLALVGDDAVQVSGAGKHTVAPAPAPHVTAEVMVETLRTPMGVQRASAGSVSLAPSARTAGHSHPLGKTLIVTAGVGRVHRWGAPIEEILAGDAMRIAPRAKHWHGAARGSAMTQIAITVVLDGKTANLQ